MLASAVNLPNNSRCFAELDATTKTLSVPLDRDSFDISVNDPNGNDPNRIFNVVITVATAPEFGQILRTSSNDTPVALFGGHDLFNNTIIYHFSNWTAITTTDTFYLTFQYGHGSSGPVPFSVCIRHIPVPTLEHVGFVYLARGSIVSINTSHLLATDTRGGLNHSLHYEITQAPRHGILFNQSSDDSNVHVENFTQEDVNKNHIAYSHRDMATSRLNDSFLFKVCTLSAPPDNEASTHYTCTRVQTFSVSIHVVNLTVINTGFEVEEGNSFSIGISELDAIPPPGYYVEFHILSNPKNGHIYLRDFPESDVAYFQHRDLVNRRIVYSHDEQETLHDSFEFLVRAESSVDSESRRLEVSDVVNITILPVNNWAPEFVNRELLVVVTGGFTVISSSILKAHDSDSDMRDEDLVYNLHFPTPIYGYIYFEEAPTVPISRWTEGDLRSGRVFYKHRGSNNPIKSDIIIFLLTDGQRPVNNHIEISILDIILQDVAPLRGKFNVTEGSQAVITQEYLQHNATNDRNLLDEHYVYNIKSTPLYGTLLFNNITATNFTQQDLETGRLVYAHDNSNTVRDSFNFTITVPTRRNFISEVYTFPIEIVPIDDDPPEVLHIARPLFVVELQTVEIGSSEIEIYDLDSKTDPQAINITCTLIDGPHYGLIQYHRFSRIFENPVDFTNYDLLRDNVIYNHTILGHWNDYFVFNLTDQINPQNETYRVDIVILPWIVPLNVSEVVVDEGDAFLFGRNNFEVLHPHLSEAFGCITVTRQPYHGSLINTITGSNVSNFTTSDLENGSIVYQHVGDESKNDSFWFVYDAHEPPRHVRRSNDTQFPIVIFPVNDEPPVLHTYEGTASLWVGQTITLNQTYLNATDRDTPPNILRYNYTLNIDGIITYSDSQTGRSIQSFTQAEVDAERVVFKHISEFDGTLVFTVTDGIQSSHGQIDISANELKLKCNPAANLSVSMQGSVTITGEQLLCTTNDYSSPVLREIEYSVRELEYGKILVDSVETSRFNQSDVNAGLVVYSHTDLDRWESEEVLIVSAKTDLAVNSPAVVLTIHISHPSTPHSSLAVNRVLEVVEGGRACLSESVLDARNLRYNTWRDFNDLFASVRDLSSVFYLSSLPQHGFITINGEQQNAEPIKFNQTIMATGSVCYHHDGTDTLADSLPFRLMIETISDSSNTFNDSRFVESLNVSITPVNDEWPYLVTTELNITVVQGFEYTFVPEVLKIQDQDNPPEELEYIITSLPGNGDLFVRNSTIRVEGRFKQAAINDGLLKFKPRDVGHGNFSFKFNDIDHMSVNITRFDVSVVEHYLQLLSNEEATYKQNEGGVTITTNLLNTSTNGIRGETQFVVKNVPAHGEIVGPRDRNKFTQAEVDSGVVRYRNRDPSFHNDSLKVCIMNRNLNTSDVIIPIRVVVWGEVKTQEELDFTTGLSLPLSSDLLNLDQLQSTLHEPPMIQVISPPRYGYLKFNYVTTVRKRSPTMSNEQFSFRYDELKNGWVFYTWNSTENYTVTDSMIVLVQASGAGLQPGEAEISITIHPPATIPGMPSPPTSPDTTNTPLSFMSTANPSADGFPMYALIPILGIFFILIIMIAVVVVFCLTQQKRIRMKWQPKVASTNHPYPWSASPTTVPRPVIPTQYDFDLAGGEVENEDNSETSSGFSEPITPTRHSPNHPRLSPTYSNPPAPRSRLGRVHSSVSITLLNHSSVASDASLEDHSYFSRSQQQPPRIAVPIPIRPVSHSPVRRTSRETVESGYLSTRRPAAEASMYSSINSKQEVPTPSEMSVSADPSPLPPSESGVADTSIKGCTSSTTGVPVSSSNELLEPELMKLFRSSPPVLKSHEYWV